jgi:thioesterase domain-containing protein/acyl carrier protein
MIPPDAAKSSTSLDKVPSDFWLALRANVKRRRHVIPIIPIPRDAFLELSYSQERLWLIDQRQENSSVHNLLHIFYLEGLVNVTILESCIREIIQRHEVLRTSFPSVEGCPAPIILSKAMFELPVSDLQTLSSEQWAAKVQSLALEYADQPFDLASGPLWRFKLLRLSPNNYALIRVIHHIIFDGWSNSVFIRELDALYEAFTIGNPSPLADLPIQYVDFAYAQRQWFRENLFSEQLAYWTKQFDDKVSALELPIDYSRAIAQSERGKCHPVVLSESLTKALKTLSHQQGVSLFATLLATLKALLFCYTRQEDMIVCSPVASRQRNETKDLIGYFNNVVALRTDLSGNPSFQELLRRVSQVALEAYENQDIPLQQVATLPSLLRTPLTRFMFALQNISNQSQQVKGLKIRSEFVEREITNFDLSLLLQEVEGKLVGRLQYKSDLFDPGTIAQLVERFQNLLEKLSQESKCYLLDLPMFEGSKSSQTLCDEDRDTHIIPQEDLLEHCDAPLDEFEQQLTRIWEEILQVQSISRVSNFFELGGHSLLAVTLFTRIEEIFGKKLPLSALFEAPTVKQLAHILHQEEYSYPWYSLVPIQPNGSKPPLFAAHYFDHGDLSHYLGADQPIFSFAYGLAARRVDYSPIPPNDVVALAAHYIQEMRTFQPEGPYFLMGLSFGGNVAFEMAQQLEAQGQKVALLVLFDSVAFDSVGQATEPFPPSKQLYRGFQLMQAMLRVGPAATVKKIKNKLVQNLSRFTRKAEHNSKLINRFVSDLYSGKVILFRATDNLTYSYEYPPDLGWSNFVSGELEVYDVPGNHMTILEEPHIHVLSEKLRACLEIAQADVSEIFLNDCKFADSLAFKKKLTIGSG